jgi:predicted amidohydrolase
VKLVLVQPQLSYSAGTHNLEALHNQLAPLTAELGPQDVVLLPEHVVIDVSREAYQDAIAQLARRLGCHVVGGSHHEQRGSHRINAGVVCDDAGRNVAEYEKLRPYAGERTRVDNGKVLGELMIGRCRILILICADFWFSDVFARAEALPDLVLVPAHSVSRKPEPAYSRALWQHLAVARAYEFGVFVGVSDWAYAKSPGSLPPSGVSGLADPTTIDEQRLFTPLDSNHVRSFDLDLDALEAFRADRRARGFFWMSSR